ncbi:DNA (cytosine-5-)-methyltransferase [[Clostridium] innocuum]|nr:DNA (cytosine-5-)-methyltransferase [[Clostridium] innocuum]
MEQNNNLTMGSLFDGSGGFPLGGLISGITPLWASEVEPFPIRVTTKRLPQVKHYGDVSKINGADVPPVDIITFGSPCQDMSVAGKRSGLDGERSSLFYQAVRIVKEMRCKTNGKYPRFVVWENVPGAFSSNKGEDFKAVLDSLCKIKSEDYAVPPLEKGKWDSAGSIVGEDFSLAWRVFDAQYWGVPQRRKRIYLVADFAAASAGKILFESEGVSGYSSQSFCPWKGTAGDFKGCTGTAGTVCLNDQGGNRMDVTEGMTCTLRAESKHPPLVFENHSQDTRYTGPLEQAPTVSSTYGTGGNNQPFVLETPKTLKIRSGCEGGGKGALVQDDLSATLGCSNDQTLFVPKCYGICAKDSNSMKSDNPHSGIYEADTSRCLDANGGNPACNQGGIVVVEGNGSRPSHKGDGYKESDVMYTLNTTEQHAVVYAIDRESYNCGANFARKLGISEDGINSTLNAQGPSAVAAPVYSSSKASFFTSAEEELANTLVATDYKDPPIVNDVSDVPEYIVRRLTPTECARLQGFPDWWCSDLGTAEPTEEEIKWWWSVFETHREIMGTSTKPKSEKQIAKWLRDPQSDSAEYKMWGNGVALPNVVFVLSGIVYYTQNERDEMGSYSATK